MWIIVVVFSALIVWAVTASIVAVLRDGYRAVPTRPPYENEGLRNRFGLAPD